LVAENKNKVLKANIENEDALETYKSSQFKEHGEKGITDEFLVSRDSLVNVLYLAEGFCFRRSFNP
jgi:hypothetical protein